MIDTLETLLYPRGFGLGFWNFHRTSLSRLSEGIIKFCLPREANRKAWDVISLFTSYVHY